MGLADADRIERTLAALDETSLDRIVVPAPAGRTPGFTPDDLLWILTHAPSETLILRPQPNHVAEPEPAEEEPRTRAVVHRARTERTTVEAAARDAGVPLATVRYWAADALEPCRAGHHAATRQGEPALAGSRHSSGYTSGSIT